MIPNLFINVLFFLHTKVFQLALIHIRLCLITNFMYRNYYQYHLLISNIIIYILLFFFLIYRD